MTSPPSKRKRWLLRVGLLLVAVALGLGLAEMVFRARDLAAFPHLRCYRPDAELGLQLEPGRIEKIRFGGAEVTTVRINDEGLRGPALAPPSPNDILVLGDSQAFGLGVEEDETFSAVLGRTLGRTVVNAGVPTYGPLEYAIMAERRLAARPARTVIVLLAYQNDFFEAERPNAERHAAWDGWAVRKENAPEHTTAFPGRLLLYRESHLFYALRRALHREPSPGTVRVASGGSVADFLPLAERARAQQEQSTHDRNELGREMGRLTNSAQARLDAENLFVLVRQDEVGTEGYLARRALLRAATAHPGDIVEEGLGEGEERLSLTATASVIAEGAKLRAQLIERWWNLHGETVRASRAQAGELHAKLTRLRVGSSPIAPSLHRIAEQCKRVGAQLIVVGLPTDTMVSPEAFAKYGEPAVDMSAVSQLEDDLRVATEAVGGTWLALLPELQRLGLPAYLPKEFHLSVAGHALVAERLAALVPRTELPRPTAPTAPLGPFAEVRCEGCSADFDPEARVDAAGVLYLRGLHPVAGTLPPQTGITTHGVLIDLAPGEQVRTRYYSGEVVVGREANGTYVLTPQPRDGAGSGGATARCEHELVLTETLFDDRPDTVHVGRHCLDALPERLRDASRSTFGYLRNALSADEAATLHVGRIRACATGDATFAPACAPGEVRVGPSSVCRPLCDATHSCPAEYECVAYRGANVCAPNLETDPSCLIPPADSR